MNPVGLKKTFTIELDVIDGKIHFLNPDELSYIEILGMIEYAKMMVMQDWLDEK